MRRAIILVLGLGSLLVATARPADDEEEVPSEVKRGKMTEAQKAVRQEMIAKYDKNKNGILDPEERKAITPEDKQKLARVGLGEYTPRRRRIEPQPH